MHPLARKCKTGVLGHLPSLPLLQLWHQHLQCQGQRGQWKETRAGTWMSLIHTSQNPGFFLPSFTDYYYFQIRYEPLSPPYNHRMQPKRRYKYLFSFFLATNVLFIYLEFNNEESKVEGNRQSAECYIWSVSLSRHASWPLIVSSTVKGFVLF